MAKRKAKKTPAKRTKKKPAAKKKPAKKAAKRPAKKATKKAAKKTVKKTATKKRVIKKADKRAASTRAKKTSTKAAKKESRKIKPVESLFGTDGVRGMAGDAALTPEKILALGRALGAYLNKTEKGKERPMVLLGVDPRPSADMVGTSLASGLIAECCDVHWPGMMSTPEVAFLTGHGPFAAGIVVTASHNPAHDNGIKIFGADGRKLSEKVERELEKKVLSGGTVGKAKPNGDRFGWLHLGRENRYEDYIVKTFRKSFASLKKRNLSVVVDAAFGARSIDLQLMSRLAHSLAFGRTQPSFQVGAPLAASGEAMGNALDLFFLNAASPTHPESHHMINQNCGSTHPQGCADAVKKMGADIGICFDGDGDRCILVDETGAICDGDHMLALLAADMKSRGVLKSDTVISTTMANLGLENALKELGIKLVRTDVGDKYVAWAMIEHKAVLGGEQSGHIILTDEGHLAGDGLYTALRVIEVMLDTGKPLSELASRVTKYPQTIVNLRVKSKPNLTTLKTLRAEQKKVEKELGNGGRINIRYSGTEPLLRIMVEARDDATLKDVVGRLKKAATKDLK